MRRRFCACLLVILCCVLASDVEAARRKRPRKGTAQEPAARGITRYDKRLFGPEVPLANILKKLGIAAPEGKVPGARVVVLKRERRLELFAGDVFLKAYRVQLGPQPVGPKQKLKDGRTPEGDYVICHRRPSKYHRALWINYPNAEDARRGVAAGLIGDQQLEQIDAANSSGKCPPQTTRLGGYLMFHGQDPSLTNWLARAQRKGSVRLEKGREPGDGNPANLEEVWDWTQGCIALLNPDIRELYEALPDVTPVTIRASGEPTRPGPWPPRTAPSPAGDAAEAAGEKARPAAN